jgi:hypothetical protein
VDPRTVAHLLGRDPPGIPRNLQGLHALGGRSGLGSR